MKKLNFALTIISILLFQLSQAQMLGKWIIPTSYIGSKATCELIFNDDNSISYNILNLTSLYPSPVEFSAGGYNSNYDTDFYVLGQTFCYGANASDWVSTGSPGLQPEYQVIQKPGNPGKYYSFYTGVNLTNRELDFHFCYNEIEYGQEPNSHIIIRGGIGQDGFVAFAITPEEQLPIHLYASTLGVPMNPIYKSGLRRWTINSNGVVDEQVIIDEDHDDLNEQDFDAYNLELKIIDEDEFIIAWINGGIDQEVDRIIAVFVSNGTPQVYIWDLNYGRIGGIEFSSYEDNVLYASCTDEGIVKVDYSDYNNIDLSTLTNSGNYDKTFLQTAPDGHIYGVSNDGRQLGKIDMQTGIFYDDDVFTFPNYQSVATYREFDGVKYYILPENERVYNPPTAYAEVTNVSCPGYADGTATIYVTGGTPGEDPEYTIDCKNEDNNPIGEDYYNDDENYFYFSGLYEGPYTYTITDDLGATCSGDFVIGGAYDFEGFKDVTEDQTWIDYNYAYELGIIIRDGIELHIDNSHLEFGEYAKIIIEAGAKLIVNNTVLTNLDCEPQQKWKGIEVWGNSNAHQFTINGNCAQGKLYLQNNAVIENARNAVRLWNPDGQYSEGGIVIARDSEFRNNERAAEFVPYQNFSPGTGEPTEYISFFKNCDFVIDDNYILPVEFDAHITLQSVYGIDFKGCRFSNNNTDAQNTGNAILSIDAGFWVADYCSATILPCPPENYFLSEFNNFYAAIEGYNERSVNTIFINDAVFSNNSYGVKLGAVNNATIINSEFNIGPNTRDEGKCIHGEPFGTGIELTGCTGFAIEENTFSKTEGAPNGDYIGIYIAETHATDEVYNNDFENLSYGNYAVGKNWGDYTYEGLAYYCNENTGNYEDFKVKKNDDDDGGIQNPIGSVEMPSGNTFSSNANYHIYNDGEYWIGYFYYAPTPGNTSTVYYPDEVFQVTREEVVGIQNECLSHYGGGGSSRDMERGIVLSPEQKLETEQEFAAGLNEYNNVRALYENLKDGGNTTGELLDIATAQPDDMWELRTQLLGDSPHLSMDVLKAAADKTTVFPESAIFDIMAANPDELKKDELINHLEEKENPLPAYMIDILRQVATGTTYKTVLQRGMAQANRLKTRAAHDIIRSILNDTLIDYNELRNWLDNMGGMRADEQIIATYMQEGNHGDALTLVNMMPGLYSYDEDELAEHSYYTDMLNLQVNLAQEERNILELNSDEVNSLVYIAENSTATAGIQAKGILEFAYGYEYCNCINTDTTGLKSGGKINADTYRKLYNIAVNVKPNPAREWAAFDYNLPDNDTEGIIKITDVAGKLIENIHITGKQGQKLWDTRKVKPGVYFYTLTVNGISKSDKVVISK